MSDELVSDDEEGEDSEEEGDEQRGNKGQTAASKRFDMDEWDSSSDEKRVILTSAEKLSQKLMETVGRINDFMELSSDLKAPPADADISEWPTEPLIVEARKEVEAGLALLVKYKKGVSEEGIPGFWVRECARFHERIMGIYNYAKKNKAFAKVLPKDTNKNLNAVVRFVQTKLEEGSLGKLLQEYTADMSNVRWLDPAAKEEQEVNTSEEEEKERARSGPRRGTREFWEKQAGDTSSEGEEDDASWLEDSAESGEEGREREEKKVVKAKPGAKTKKHKEKTQTAAKEGSDGEDGEEDGEVASGNRKAEPLEELVELKEADIDRLFDEMSAQRGRLGIDYSRMLSRVELILPQAKNDVQRIKLLILWVNTRFDSLRSTKARLSAKDWHTSVVNIGAIIATLRKNSNIRLLELDSFYEPELEQEEGEQEAEQDVARLGGDDMTAAKRRQMVEKNKSEAVNQTASGKVVISGSLFSLLERLDATFVRTLRNIDPHTQEYVSRLADDPEFVALAKDMLQYQESIGDSENAARSAHAIVSHLYFKSHTPGTDGNAPKRHDCSKELQKYATIVYKSGSARSKAHVMLMCIYHYALMDNFTDARDRMLMSHLQEKAQLMDIDTQVLFNRTNVQIGLCAFRAGLIREAHSALSEIYAGGRVKELLAQGTSSQRYQDKDKEQEKLEKSRMMPFHMHINLELLESCHLIAAMILEVPAMAMERYSKGSVSQDNNKVMSKYLRKLVDYHERQVFAGPPETTRDFVVSAARALSRGNWKKTQTLLLSMPAWELIDGKETVKKMLAAQIQETGLRTYLFTYCNTFETLSITMLAELFELSEKRVHAIVSGMMLSEELRASFSQPTKTIVLHHVEPSSLQNAAMKYTAKVAALLESNEALLESRFFSYGGNSNKGESGGKDGGKDGDYPNSKGSDRNRDGGNRGGNRRGGSSYDRGGSSNYDDDNSNYRPKRR